jgi:hypothetical protein
VAVETYDAAKKAHRQTRAKGANHTLIQVYRLQADALEIEAGAKRRRAESTTRRRSGARCSALVATG